MILTNRDYDEYYLESSVLSKQIESFITHHRLVVAGFGFNDEELTRIFRIVGRRSSPDRPIYAFLRSSIDFASQRQMDKLRNECNIVVIPYRTHGDLRHVISLYDSMIVKRSMNFRGSTPAYDPETTSLLLYNTLALDKTTKIEEELAVPLLEARILSLASAQSYVADRRHRDRNTFAQASLLLGHSHGESEDSSDFVFSVFSRLVEKELAIIDAEGNLRLTNNGASLVDEHKGISQRISASQFKRSIQARLDKQQLETEASQRVSHVIAEFFLDAMEKRSLGVVKALYGHEEYREFQAVALLQAIPEHLLNLESSEEATLAIGIIQAILASPSEAESKYMGLILQTQLGMHLLGVDRYSLDSRKRVLSETVFILDSTTLIPLLAPGSTGHLAARDFIDRGKRIGVQFVTTDYLVEEIAEHANWAYREQEQSGGSLTIDSLATQLGYNGKRTNVFLEAFYQAMASNTVLAHGFESFMRVQMKIANRPVTTQACADLLLVDYAIPTLSFSQWSGFSDKYYVDAEDIS